MIVGYMDAVRLVRRDTEKTLSGVIDFNSVYAKCNQVLEDAQKLLPAYITEQLNESELIVLYFTKLKENSVANFSEDVFISNVCHKFCLDVVKPGFYPCAMLLCNSFYLTHYHSHLGADNFSLFCAIQELVKGSDIIVAPTMVLSELLRWCDSKQIDLLGNTTIEFLKDTLCLYVCDVLRKDIVNWNKPFKDDLDGLFSCYHMYYAAVSKRLNLISSYDRSIDIIENYSKYFSHYTPTLESCLVSQNIMSAIELVVGVKNAEMYVNQDTGFEDWLLPYVAYYVSSKFFYEDYLIDKNKRRL